MADLEGKARFTVATYVRHGGLGGENAAVVSAQLARFLIENGTEQSFVLVTLVPTTSDQPISLKFLA